MKIKTLLFSGALALALTASFAFKPVAKTRHSKQFINGSIWDPYETWACDDPVPVSDNCSQSYTGPQCTYYYDSNYPAVPAYAELDGAPSCTYPLYQYQRP